MLTKEEIFKVVQVAIIQAMFEQVKDDDIKMSTHIIEDLNAESMDVAAIIMELEDAFGATIEQEEVQDLLTVEKIVNYIFAKQTA